MSRHFIDEPTIEEMISDKNLSELTTTTKNNKSSHLMSNSVNLTITQEKINSHKDKIEKQTGVFHWLQVDENTKDRRYIPVHALTDDQLNRAMNHCEELQVHLQKQIDEAKKQLEKIQSKLDYTLKFEMVLDKYPKGCSTRSLQQAEKEFIESITGFNKKLEIIENKTINRIKNKFNQICAWQYRLEQLEEEKQRREEDRPNIVGDSQPEQQQEPEENVEKELEA